MERLASGSSTTPHCSAILCTHKWVTDWRILIFTPESDLSREAEREAAKPDEEVRKEWPPAWHIPSLHKSDFMALSHAALLQAQTAGIISVHYRHPHKSQALPGWEFMQEMGSFRILPLLYLSLLKRWMTALKRLFLVIISEGSVGIYTKIQTLSEELTKLMVEIFRNLKKFLWISGNTVSLFFLSHHQPLYLCSVRTRCSAHQRDSQSCDLFQGEPSSRWKERKKTPTRWEKVGNQKH